MFEKAEAIVRAFYAALVEGGSLNRAALASCRVGDGTMVDRWLAWACYRHQGAPGPLQRTRTWSQHPHEIGAGSSFHAFLHVFSTLALYGSKWRPLRPSCHRHEQRQDNYPYSSILVSLPGGVFEDGAAVMAIACVLTSNALEFILTSILQLAQGENNHESVQSCRLPHLPCAH